MFKLIEQSLLLLPPRLRLGWIVQILSNLLLGGFEFLSAFIILLTVQLIERPESITELPGSPLLFSTPPSMETTLSLMGLVLAFFFLIKNLLGLGVVYLRNFLVGHSAAVYSQLLLERYLQTDYQFHLDHSSAELINNVNSTAENVSTEGLGAVSLLLQESFVILGLWAVILVTTPRLGIIIPLLSGGGILILRQLTGKYMKRCARWVHEARQEMLQKTQQMLGALIEIRLSGREKYFLSDFKKSQTHFVNSYAQAKTWGEGNSMVLEVLFAFVIAITLIILGQFWDTSNKAIIPLLGAYAYIFFRLIPAAKFAMIHLSRLEYGRFHIERLLHHGNLRLEHSQVTGKPLRLQKELTLAQLGFTYPSAPQPAVKDVSANIGYGESIGLVGASGAGKTTLMLLLLGLLPPTQGQILVDGCNINENLPGWRRGIGYVSQQVYLLNDTVRRNIALGFADREIDDQWLTQCAEMACLNSVIQTLPQGLDTIIGENGVRLSGGQRQRFAIARALYHRPEILLLDEATSALDSETEKSVTEAIQNLQGEITMIVIAHRLSTVRHCDRLFFLKNGCLVDVASYDELYQRNHEFKRMADSALARSLKH